MAVDGRGSADKFRALAEQCEILPVPVDSGLETAVDTPLTCLARAQRRRGGGDTVGLFPMLPGGLLKFRPGVRSTSRYFAK